MCADAVQTASDAQAAVGATLADGCQRSLQAALVIDELSSRLSAVVQQTRDAFPRLGD